MTKSVEVTGHAEQLTYEWTAKKPSMCVSAALTRSARGGCAALRPDGTSRLRCPLECGLATLNLHGQIAEILSGALNLTQTCNLYGIVRYCVIGFFGLATKVCLLSEYASGDSSSIRMK
jgi:hypothetical protein